MSFNTCSSCEEQLDAFGDNIDGDFVSIHAPLARSNSHSDTWTLTRKPFQYMLLLRGATNNSFIVDHSRTFQYMLLLRGATIWRFTTLAKVVFQYMLLLRGATTPIKQSNWQRGFQYMLLLRGATMSRRLLLQRPSVSIHAPLARSNFCLLFLSAVVLPVSIHAPLARSNFKFIKPLPYAFRFNTCSSCEEQQTVTLLDLRKTQFQYMLLLRGATGSLNQ